MTRTLVDLELLPRTFSVCRFSSLPRDGVPGWALSSPWFCLTRTSDEFSVVLEESCLPSVLPPDIRTEKGWRNFKVRGPLDFGLVGILAGLANTLAAAQVSIFAISTFDTDYVLIKEADLGRGCEALRAAGYRIHGESLAQ